MSARRTALAGRTIRAQWHIFAAAIALAGCATAPKESPKLITEDAIRATLVAERTATVLRTLEDDRLREALARFFNGHATDARRRGVQYTVDKILVGEDIGIGAGAKLRRVFALAYEHSPQALAGYLEAIEVLNDRVRTSLRTQVALGGVQLATLEFLDLDRAAVRTYRYAEQDPRCCPSVIVDRVYAWRGITLEELRADR